jgi:hypothetical protein
MVTNTRQKKNSEFYGACFECPLKNREYKLRQGTSVALCFSIMPEYFLLWKSCGLLVDFPPACTRPPKAAVQARKSTKIYDFTGRSHQLDVLSRQLHIQISVVPCQKRIFFTSCSLICKKSYCCHGRAKKFENTCRPLV